ncbi:sulfite exporter TauE/SafE family protein [Alteraurantiacibacter aquimixticola]|uniref:Probable membrane transporter protein n=1 Tax=Alteraurantiacibacter aquimixticola TaxID=2489173 RepID=A0A4T3F382_9SPHN|nr:sulfite exporter TauE/SafE family protein [Alteraurantiacibacter aquimixticola]TIX51663.1 sulfite exporter TauE/SafE family protein [Alteraurantiacibacter aquimixticola]
MEFLAELGFHEILPFILIGFAAQLIDGALGMAFGVVTQTLLVAGLGLPPATASASVHIVEVFTTGASGASHLWRRNINWPLFWRLVPAGVIGGVTGAYLLSNIDASAAKPYVMLYLAAIGVLIFFKALFMGRTPRIRDPKYTRPLALTGGFLDAAGGGGWGPVVTSNLLVQGSDPRTTIGTVNSAEFVLTIAVSVTFIAALGLAAFSIAIVGLVIGGVIAAPIGAILVSKVRPRVLLFLVAGVLTVTSIYGLISAWPF